MHTINLLFKLMTSYCIFSDNIPVLPSNDLTHIAMLNVYKRDDKEYEDFWEELPGAKRSSLVKLCCFYKGKHEEIIMNFERVKNWKEGKLVSIRFEGFRQGETFYICDQQAITPGKTFQDQVAIYQEQLKPHNIA
jgi:hypothetical protein